MRNGDSQLPDGPGEQGGHVAHVLAQAGVASLGQLDEHDQCEGGEPPQHEAKDVAGVAVVPLTGRPLVEADRFGSRHLDHVVPSLDTAATTRSTKTTPSSSPP